MKCAFHAVVFAALLAGCSGAKQDRNDKDTFGQAFTWEWRKQNAALGAKPPADANKERQEFEEWRAWQEWKRKNQK